MWRGIICLGCWVVLGGCGPIVGGVQILNADITLSAARTAGAEQAAAYEYHAAREYLAKAREELGYSDFWAARTYADRALSFAGKARSMAVTVAKANDSSAASSTTKQSP